MKLVSSIFSIISFLMVINVAWLHSAARLGLQAGAPEWMKAVWGLSVPYFFLLAMFWQWARFERFERCEECETFCIALAAVVLSILCAVGLKKLMPRVAGVLFGGR